MQRSWQCPKCGQINEPGLNRCWSCGFEMRLTSQQAQLLSRKYAMRASMTLGFALLFSFFSYEMYIVGDLPLFYLSLGVAAFSLLSGTSALVTSRKIKRMEKKEERH